MSKSLGPTLAAILATKQQELQPLKHNLASNSFHHLFQDNKRMVLIAELKRQSPSSGKLFSGNAEELIGEYESAGVDAISVVTDKHYFGYVDSDFSRVRNSTKLPILRKDFVVDTVQIVQAYNDGADAVLLIARIVDKSTLHKLIEFSCNLGIVPIVEICEAKEISKIAHPSVLFVAVNVRDLETFTLDYTRVHQVMNKLPMRYKKLVFSGIHNTKDIKSARSLGANGVLVGTSLLRSSDRRKLIQSFRTAL